MSTYVKTITKTDVTDKRQVAEGEYIAGPDSIMSLPYSIALGESSRLSVTGADPNKIVGGLLTNMDSTVGQLLGIQSQMAQGMFELSPKIIAEVKGFEATKAPQPINKNLIYIIGGIALLFLFLRR